MIKKYNGFKARTVGILSERIYLARKRNHLTQQELAQKCGIHKNSILEYEKGNHVPSVIALAKIAIVLNISTDYLLGLK